MIWNPGQFPADWTLEKLMAKHASHPFNPDIANAFFRAGLMESWGRGMERITEACEQNGYPAPVWTLEPGGLWVAFAYSPDQADQVTDQITEQIHTLLQVMQGEMKRTDIQTRLGMRHTPHVRSAYLQPALTVGWVEMTTPDKPTSRLQKYRLTEAGRRLQTALRAALPCARRGERRRLMNTVTNSPGQEATAWAAPHLSMNQIGHQPRQKKRKQLFYV